MSTTAVNPVPNNTEPIQLEPQQPPAEKPRSKIGKVFGSVLGGMLNVVAPSAGTMIGSVLRTGGVGYAAQLERVMAESNFQQMQLIGVQMRVHDHMEQFTTVSNLLRSRHDGDMEAIRNFKS